MAERRMFSKTIIDSDAFLDMPLSAQALYFHLSMRADDEGFIGNPKKIRNMIGATEDDLKLLIAKRFLLVFDSGVVVIKHWKIHNYIQSDRFKPTTYIEERDTLALDGKNAYTEALDTKWMQNGYKMDTQVRLGKDRLELGKDSSKQVSKKEEERDIYINNNARESYDEIFSNMDVDGIYKEALLRFIKHLKVNYNTVMMNDRLESLIVRLDGYYREDAEKVKVIDDAIVKGYRRLDIECRDNMECG